MQRFSVAVGEVSQEALDLMEATRLSLEEGIKAAQPGNRIGDIGAAVQTFGEARGYGVVREFVGHGIGRFLHEDPQVPNYGQPGRGQLLRAGMCIAIEPMLNIGDWKTRILDDNWTVVTRRRLVVLPFRAFYRYHRRWAGNSDEAQLTLDESFPFDRSRVAQLQGGLCRRRKLLK